MERFKPRESRTPVRSTLWFFSVLTHLCPLPFQPYVKNLGCLRSEVLWEVHGEVVNIGETGNSERKHTLRLQLLLQHLPTLPHHVQLPLIPVRLGSKGVFPHTCGSAVSWGQDTRMILHPKNSWGANTASPRLWEGDFRGQDRAEKANPPEGSFEALPYADHFLNLKSGQSSCARQEQPPHPRLCLILGGIFQLSQGIPAQAEALLWLLGCVIKGHVRNVPEPGRTRRRPRELLTTAQLIAFHPLTLPRFFSTKKKDLFCVLTMVTAPPQSSQPLWGRGSCFYSQPHLSRVCPVVLAHHNDSFQLHTAREPAQTHREGFSPLSSPRQPQCLVPR